MSKVIKEMEMEALRDSLRDVRDMVVMSIRGLTAQADHALRSSLRKKNVRVRVVKNSLTRKVLSELGVHISADSPLWVGPTVLVWGGGSIAEVSRTLDGELRAPKTAAQYRDKVMVKGAVADGLPVTFEQALKMPTRAEAAARVVSLALAPASRLVGQLRAPASRVVGQIKTLSDKETGDKEPSEGEAGAPAAAAPPA